MSSFGLATIKGDKPIKWLSFSNAIQVMLDENIVCVTAGEMLQTQRYLSSFILNKY